MQNIRYLYSFNFFVFLLLSWLGTGSLMAQPTVQPSDFNVGSVTSTSIDLSWTRGDGGFIIILAREGSAVNANPSDNVTYTANATFPSGDQIGSGNYVVFVGTGTNVTVTGLSPFTTYHFAAYEFDTGGLPDPNYLIVAPALNNAITDCEPPSNQVNGASFTSIEDQQMTINWTGGNGERTLVVAKEGSAVDFTPVVGTDYITNSNFGTGEELGTGNFGVFEGTDNDFLLTGLNALTTYHFAFYEFNAAGFCYQLVGAFTANETTACTPPTSSAGTLSFSATSNSQTTLSWSGGNGDQSLILAREGAAVDADPVVGTDYTANATFGNGDEIGTGNFVVYEGSANSTTVDGLSGATNYHFAIYEFNTTGSCYRLINPQRNDVTTECTPPAGQASSITFSNTMATTMEVNWSRGTPSGDGVLVVARRNSPVSFNPTNGDDYSGEVNSNFNAAQNQGGNNRIVFRGAGTSVVVTNLEPNITYHFAIFEYNDANNCYNLVGPATGQNQSSAADLNSTISNGTGSGSPLSSLAAPGSRVDVLSFTIEDLGGDNLDTDFTAITFRETGGQIADLRDLIETVELSNGSDSRTSGVAINQNDIVMTGIPINNDLGDVNNGTSSTYTLSVSFLNSFGGTLPTTVDGLRLVFSVDESDIIVPTGRSGFAPGESANSDETGGGTNNTIAVEATELNFVQQPSNAFVLTPMTPAVTVQATDSRGNRDLDYTGSVDLNSTGTLQSTPSATFSSGLGTYSAIIHTVSETGRRLSSTNSSPALTETGNSNTFTITGPAQNSDIIEDGSFSYPTNIQYNNFQENTDITASASSLEVAGFTIRDGGSGNDGDLFGTELTSIEFNLTNGGFIRRAALYGDLDDNGSYETELDEVIPIGNTLTFDLDPTTITAPDDGTIDFAVRVSFTTTVADNAQFSFQIATTAFDAAGSGFASANAGGATSSTSGDNNRIEVIATAQQFTVQPDPLELQDAPIDPQPEVIAIDANGIQDMDYNGSVTVSAPVTISGAPTTYSNGTLTFSGFTYTSSGDGTITVESGGLSDAISNAVTVDGTPPTAVINDNHPDDIVRNADNFTITVEFSEAIDDTPGPTISIGSAVTNAALNQVDADTWNFVWNVPGGVDENAAIAIVANDPAGNALSSIFAGTGPTTYIIDNTRPTVSSITRLDPSPTLATSIRFQVIFSEPVVGVGTGDFTLVASSGTISSVTGSGDTYVVTAAGLAGLTETVGLDVLIAGAFPAVIDDIAGNRLNVSFTAGEVYEIDNLAPDVGTLNPANNQFNIPVTSNLFIQFNEDITVNTGIIRLRLFSDNSIIETFSVGSVGFNGTDELEINPSSDLLEGIQYYIEIDAGAVRDIAGNLFGGISGNTDWNFTTFSSPVIANVPSVGCVGEDVTITGTFLTGVTSAVFYGTGGVEIVSTGITVINDNEIEVTIPTYGSPITSVGDTLTLRKTGGGNPDAETTSDNATQAIQVGPASAVLSLVTGAPSVLCNSGSNTQTSIQIDIRGGTGPFFVDYGVGSLASYNNGQITNVQPALGNNNFNLINVTDNSLGCVIPDAGPLDGLSGSFNVRVNERPIIDAGGNGQIDYCPSSQGNTINLNGTVLGSALPSLTNTGDCQSPGCGVMWSADVGSGSFTNGTSLNNARYNIDTNDLLRGFVRFSITSTNQALSCDAATDTLRVNFISDATANPGGQGGILEFCWDGSNNPEVQLNGIVSGGATPQWSVVSNDGGFITSVNINNPIYRFGNLDQAADSAIVRLTPNGGSCGTGGTAEDLIIRLIPNPNPSFQSPNLNVCVGDQNVVYQVQNSAGSTYQWTDIDGGDIITEPNDLIGQGTSTVIMNWGNLAGSYRLQVVETDANGCVSVPEIQTIVINDLPNPSFIEPSLREFDLTADPVELVGGNTVPPAVTPSQVEGVFSGTGVFFIDNSGPQQWFFDPEQAGLTTPGNEHPIDFTYTDANGCTNTITEDFVVRDSKSSILVQGTSNFIPDEYCEDTPEIVIQISPNIIANPDASFEFTGPGISQNGVNGIGTAIFTPSDAFAVVRESEFEIFYGDASGRLGERTLKINAKPDPSGTLNELLNLRFCEDSNPINLVVGNSVDVGAGEVALIFVDDSDQDQTITQINSTNFQFSPSAAEFSILNTDPDNSFAPLELDVQYNFVASTGCDTTISRRVEVFQKPPPPQLPEQSFCIINNVLPEVIANGVDVTNNVPINDIVNITWLDGDSTQLSNGNNPLSQEILEQVSGISTFLVVQEVNGCISNANQVVIERLDVIDFNNNTSCITTAGIDFFPDLGTNVNLEAVVWSINGMQSEEITDPTRLAQPFNFSFAEPGLYDVTMAIRSSNQCIDEITKSIVVTRSEAVSNETTYFENFDDNPGGGWVASGTNSSWSFGSPGTGNTTITLDENNGSDVWITGLDGPYNKSERSFLYTPCFDLTGLDRPLLSFDHWVNTAAGEDGIIVEYSTTGINGTWLRLGNFDNGIQSGINWYNVRDISSNPGNQPVGFYGWSGDSEGWLSSRHSLDEIPEDQRQEVLFRFSLSSTEGSDAVDKPDGFALDNVFIGNRTRIILIENFTNVSQTANIQAEAETLENFPGSNVERVILNYHTVFPGEDPVNSLNPAPASSRALYYGISEVPRARLDGIQRTDLGDLFSAWGETEYNIRTLDNAPVNITATTQNTGSALNIEASFKALQDIAPNAVAHVAILENNVNISALGLTQVPSGQTVLNGVVREMLPAATGTKFPDQIVSDDSVSIEVTWQPTTAILDPSQVAIAIFLQDEKSGNVYQTALIDNLNLPPLITGLKAGEFIQNGIYLYPNPAHQKFNLTFNTPINTATLVFVYDQFGKIIVEQRVESGTDQIEIDTRNWVPGLYHVQLQLSDGKIVRERLMIMH